MSPLQKIFQEPLRGYRDEESRYREWESAKTQKPSVHYFLQALCISHSDDFDGSYLCDAVRTLNLTYVGQSYLRNLCVYLREHPECPGEHSAIFYKTEGQWWRTRPNVPSSNIPVISLSLWYVSCQQQQQQQQLVCFFLLTFVISVRTTVGACGYMCVGT